MSRTHWIVLLVAAVLLSPVALQHVYSDSQEKGEKEETTELHRKMEQIGEIVSSLRKQLKDPAQNADSLQKVVQLEKLTLECKELQPALLAKIPAAEQAEFLFNYRKEMVRMMTELMTLELLIAEGKNEEASKQYRDVIRVKYSGHEKFQE